MIIWIDGTLGVGKTTISWKIKENFSDSDIEFLDSDYYFEKMIQEIMEKAALNRAFPSIGGVSPQTNKKFFCYFRELIQKKSKNAKRILIVSMALTNSECKKEIFDYLINGKKKILHIILVASRETIKTRISFDKKRGDKNYALKSLESNILFLDSHFDDALRIDTDNKRVCDIANEVMECLKDNNITVK